MDRLDDPAPHASRTRRPGYARQWEDNARLDPLWAILTRTGGPWTDVDFFATGEEEARRVFAYMDSAGIGPLRRGAFLDFGCGVGRVTAPLAARFASSVGVDVSARMITLARQHAADRAPGVRFIVNPSTDLAVLGATRFSFVYAHMVLQHLRVPDQIGYVGALLEVLEPGGVAALQTIEASADGPSLPRLRTLVPDGTRRLLRRAVAALRRAPPPLARPVVAMHMLAEPRMLTAIAARGCRVLAAPYCNSAWADHRGRLELFDRAEAVRRVGSSDADNPLLARFYFVGRPGGERGPGNPLVPRLQG
jgi:2-polyprenyl-3-methyl-5-hydroxy-6-metoxy-1,4-benzoquinol methylase